MTERPADFDARVLAYMPMLYKQAAKYAPRDETDDVVQDTVASALERWQSFREGGGFHNWLYWQLRSTIGDRKDKAARRGQGRHLELVEHLDLRVEPDQETRVYAAQVWAAIPRKRRKVMRRIAIGNNLSETGRQVGLSTERVRQIAQEVRGNLQKLVA